MLHFVYELVDPRTDAVAYVGITNNPNQRLRAHITDTETNDNKQAWIEQLQKEHLKPRMRILEIVESREEAVEREKYWIQYYIEHGKELTNLQHAILKQKDDKLPLIAAVEQREEKDSKPSQQTFPMLIPNIAEESTGKRRKTAFGEAKEMCYTAGEVIEMLKVPKSTFYDMIKKERYPKGSGYHSGNKLSIEKVR